MRDNAAKTVQVSWRRHRADQMKRAARIRRMARHALNNTEDRAAIRIQKCIRGHLSRKRTKNVRSRFEAAALCVQRVWQGHQGRVVAHNAERKTRMQAVVRRIQVVWAMRGPGVQQRSVERALVGRINRIEWKQIERKETLMRPDVADEWRAELTGRIATEFRREQHEISTREEESRRGVDTLIAATIGREAAGECATRVQATFRRAGARDAVMQMRREDPTSSSLTSWLLWLHTKGLHNLAGAHRLAFKEASGRRRLESEASSELEAFLAPHPLTQRVERSDPTLTLVDVSSPHGGGALRHDALHQLLTALRHNAYVTELDLSHVASVTDFVCVGALASLLRGNARLRRIGLSHTAITDIGGSALLQAICGPPAADGSSLQQPRGRVVVDVTGTLLTRTMRERFSALAARGAPVPPAINSVVPKVKCTLLPPLSLCNQK